MGPKWRRWLTDCLSLSAAFVLASAAVGAQETRNSQGLTLVDLDFEGVHAIDENVLRALLWTKLPSPLPWSDPPALDLAELDRDLERVERAYRERGYPGAHASYRRETDESTGRTRVTIVLAEGDPILVASVELSGFEPLSAREQSRLIERIRIRPGDAAARPAIVRGAQLGIRALAEKGYAHARVNVDELETSANRVRVRYEAAPGPLAVFGDVNVVGNRELSDDDIRRQVTFERGKPFRAQALDATREELLEIGIVESAVVSTIDPADVTNPPSQADVIVHVTERQPRQTGFWLGYGTEVDFTGELEWRHLNVGGGARSLGTNARWTSVDRGVNATFLQPSFVTPRLTLSLDAFWWQTKHIVFDATTQGGTVRLAADAGRRGQIAVELAALGQRAEASDAVSDSARDDLLASLGLPSAGQDGTLAIFSVAGAYAASPASVFDTGATYAASVRLEQAGRWLPGSFRFVHLLAEARYERPILNTISLGLRARAGSIDPRGPTSNVPLFKRYFLGGAENLRGWGRDEVGPVTLSGLPTGGTSMFAAAAELTFPLVRQLRGLIFTDAGNVWARPWRLRTGDLLYDAGAGLRYRSPFGVMGVDAGYQLTPRPAPPVTGSDRDRRWRIHFTLGQSF